MKAFEGDRAKCSVAFFYWAALVYGPLMRFGPENSRVTIFTFKEGAFSALGHDLELEVGSFWIEIDPEAKNIEAEFDAGSMRVAKAAKGPGTLSERDCETIRKNIADDVLHIARFPKIRFSANGASAPSFEGDLSLHGVTNKVRIELEQVGNEWTARTKILQPDFGIKPYKAMLGALKVQPGVRAEVRLTLD